MIPDAQIDPQVICDFLLKTGATPVLVDVGASGKVHEPWRPFARESIFVGFDPDSRDLDPTLGSEFKQRHVIAKIIAGPGAAGDAPFYLTRFPHCSSMLAPDEDKLAPYLFAGLFEVEREVKCETSNLAAVMDQLGLASVDWLKVDSQGKDLSVIQGLGADRCEKLLCVEIEPGFSPFYKDEESFWQLHQALTGMGFWLAHIKCQQFARVRASTIKEAFGIDVGGLDPAAKLFGASPTAAEARYLPSLELLERRKAGIRDLAIVWCFAVTTGLWGYALEIASAARTLAKTDIAASGAARFMYDSVKATVAAMAGQAAR